MAKAKSSTTAIEVKPKQTAIAPMEEWEIEAAKEAKDEKAHEVTGLPRIVHKNAQIMIDGKAVKDNKLPIVVVDYVWTKAYYEAEYDPDAKATPVCYAFSTEGEPKGAPHEQSPDKQSDTCAGCQWNKFGTAERGRGKRCKDERRVAAIMQSSDPSEVAQAETRVFNIPPSSLKNWSNYLSSINDITPTGNVRFVVTELSAQPADKAYQLTFRAIEKLDKEFAKAVMQKKQQVRPLLLAPWPQIEAEEKPQRPAKKIKGQK